MSEPAPTVTTTAPPEPDRRRAPRAALQRPAALLLFGLAFLFGLSADLITKHLAWEHLRYDAQGSEFYLGPASDTVVAIPGMLNFTAVANRGAALGIGQGKRWLFVIGSGFAVVLLVYFFTQSGKRHFYQFVLGLLLAGVGGNLYDRVVFGYVRDLIHAFPQKQWSDLASWLPHTDVFPWVFNLADLFLCIGVTIVVLFYGILAPKPDGEAVDGEPGTEATA